jgi:hypothetical protein
MKMAREFIASRMTSRTTIRALDRMMKSSWGRAA